MAIHLSHQLLKAAVVTLALPSFSNAQKLPVKYPFFGGALAPLGPLQPLDAMPTMQAAPSEFSWLAKAPSTSHLSYSRPLPPTAAAIPVLPSKPSKPWAFLYPPNFTVLFPIIGKVLMHDVSNG